MPRARRRHCVEVRPDTRIIKLDTARKRLTTVKGSIQYGKLVLALGAQQRVLPVSGDACDRIVRVNDLGSYRQLRTLMTPQVGHVTILGAGLIGCEFADDMTSAGLAVTVIDPHRGRWRAWCQRRFPPNWPAVHRQGRGMAASVDLGLAGQHG